jgi:hypothetical protein
VIKYGLKIRTRGGSVVDNLVVAARDRAEAERKISQIYHHCEILLCDELHAIVKEDGFSFESAIRLIGNEGDTPPKTGGS